MPIRTVRRRLAVMPEPPRPPPPVRPDWTRPGRAAWALLPLACVALGGTTERWSEGLLLLALGGLLLARPPRASLGWGLHLVLGVLILLSLAAFLPARWFAAPAWRSALTADFGVTLPGTLSPQPWLTGEGVVLFAAGLTWFYWQGTVRWTDDERRRAGAIFAGGTVALAALCVGLYRAGSVPSFWHAERHFGPFPNRNQTADFFGIAALPVLAFARAAWRAGRKPAAFGWLAGWLVVAAAVFHGFSRAGIFLLFSTTGVYLVLETLHRTRHQPGGGLVRWRRLAMVVSLVLVAGTGLLIFGGDTLARLKSGGEMARGNGLSNELRLHIYADTCRMIAGSPWCGNGLNTFEGIFPTCRQRTLSTTLDMRHPESDWLWLAAELGWPGAAAAAAGVALVVRRLRPPRHGDDRSLRLAAALGVAGFIVHGLVDVSGHRIGSVFAALFLLGLALPGRRVPSAGEGTGEPGARPGRLTFLFRGLGLVFVGVGSLWLAGAFGWVLLPGEQSVQRLKADAPRLAAERDYPASAGITRALAWSPLDWQAYYLRGALGVYGGRPGEEALADFRRARFLERTAPGLPLDEALLWARAGQVNPAVNALLEACRRDPDDALGMLRAVYPAVRDDSGLFEARFGAAARRDPTLALAFLDVLDGDARAGFVAEVVRFDPELQRLDNAQRRRFFQAWASAEPRSLLAGMDTHPAWQRLGWRWWAAAQAHDGTAAAFQAASATVVRFAAKPEVPSVDSRDRTLADWRREAEATSFEPAFALGLFRAQAAAGDDAGALATLQKVTGHPDCPPYFYRLEAEAAAALQRWPGSWAAWQRYLQATRADE